MIKIIGKFSPIEQSINNIKENNMGTFVYLLMLYSVVATLKIITLKK
jgi:hypothetical protein